MTTNTRRSILHCILQAMGLYASLLVSASCVREVTVGTRPVEESDAQPPGDGGAPQDDAAAPLTCEMTDCEVSVLSTPVCEEGEELACIPEQGMCIWACLVRPLIAGETRCGSTVCNSEQFCDAPIGSCGENATNLRCVAKPSLCTAELTPVCGCNGVTLDNTCEAQRAGVMVARSNACPAPALKPCATDCEPVPIEVPPPKCPNDALNSPICAQLSEGECAWVTRKCEPQTICPQPPPVTTAGACWTAADCGAAQTCEGARICPCDADCAEPDETGTCA